MELSKELFNELFQKAYRTARFKGVPNEDSKDIAQSVIMDFYNNPNYATKEDKVEVIKIINSIIHNKIYEFYHTRQKRKESSADIENEDGISFIEGISDNSNLEETTLNDIFSKVQLKNIIEILNRDFDKATVSLLFLVYVEKKTKREIAKILNMKENTVSVKCIRAIKKLRDSFNNSS